MLQSPQRSSEAGVCSPATSVRPHYSVCRSMAPPRRKETAFCADDVAYVVKPLQLLAARTLVAEHDTKGVPQELRGLLQQARECDSHCFWMKERSCPSLPALKVGEFGRFPRFRELACADMFSVDLIASASSVLRFLHLTHNVTVDDATCERYVMYLDLQKKHAKERLLPPPDVALAQFAHMLQSAEYHAFAAEWGLEWTRHCSIWMFEGEGLKGHEERSQEIWNKAYPCPKFGSMHNPVRKYDFRQKWVLLSPLLPAVDSDIMENPCGRLASDPRIQSYGKVSGYSRRVPEPHEIRNPKPVPAVDSKHNLRNLVGVVRQDKDWLVNFRAVFDRNEFTAEELAHFQVGYQKYLYLVAKYPFRMEWIGFAPTPAIDLFWHSHLLQPRAYWRDTTFLIFGTPHHKLLPEVAREVFVYEAHAGEEAKLWQEEFMEDMREYVIVVKAQTTSILQPRGPSTPPARLASNLRPPPPPTDQSKSPPRFFRRK